MQFEHLKRRDFITLFGGAAVAWPLAARAQQAGKLSTIGFLASGTPSSHGRWLTTFVKRLSELGWVEGGTIAVEAGWAEGRRERAAEIAADFVRRKVDVIVTVGTPTSLAAKQATGGIPIVFLAVSDPVGVKLVASVAHPGGNITGLSNQYKDLAGKRVELLHRAVPALRRLATLFNVGNPAAVMEIGEVRAAADTLGLAIIPLEIRRAEDIAPAFEGVRNRADALYVQGDLLTIASRSAVHTWALGARLPTTYAFREDVESGGLMSYGPSLPAQYRHAADYVDKILRGTKPSDIPVEQPTKFELVINLTTARVFGLTIPDQLLALADEVIE
jgi:putative tryptophan/tyrosine transport system substrate-binding protein